MEDGEGQSAHPGDISPHHYGHGQILFQAVTMSMTPRWPHKIPAQPSRGCAASHALFSSAS